MKQKSFLGSLFVLSLMAGHLFAMDPHEMMQKKGHGDDPVLPGGSYSAKVKALVCEGCPDLIQKAMLSVSGISSATVDAKTKEVQFNVKDQAAVKWSSLQKALKASADKMGMGADFTLSDFRIAKQKVAAPKEINSNKKKSN